jgi:hypothetical protein
MQFIQATNYTHVNSRSIDLAVIHDGETPETITAAEGMGAYFKGQPKSSKGSSAHYGFDNNSGCQYVHDMDVAWAAPGANHDGLQFEHAGKAAQTMRDWNDKYSRDMLYKQSAPFVAAKCKQYGIPVVFLRAPDLVVQKRGITTHWQVTLAFSRGIGHTDPGKNFPIEEYMDAVRKAAGGAVSGPAVKKPQPTIKQGDKGYYVKMAQRLLNFEEKRAWDDIKVDGVFGARTTAEVKEFQTRAGLKATGAIGPGTWHALWVARYGGEV